MQRQLSPHENLNIGVVHDFIETAHLNVHLRDNPKDIDAEGRQLELRHRLSENLIGLGIVAREIQPPTGERRPIEMYNELNTGLWSDVPELGVRRIEGSNARYGTRNAFRFQKQARGSVVGIDLLHNSLVVRPWILRGPTRNICSRYWIQVVTESGEPRVDLNFK